MNTRNKRTTEIKVPDGNCDDPNDGNCNGPNNLNEQQKSLFSSKILFFTFVFSVFFEIIGKKFEYENIRISVLMNKSTHHVGNFFNKFGYYLARISDIFYMLKKWCTFIYDMIYPIFENIYLALDDIFGSFFRLVVNTVKEFLSGYSVGLEGAYVKIAAYGVSSVLLFGGSVLTLCILEAIGVNTKFNKIRPSYHITIAAKNIYYFVMMISYLYGSFSRTIVKLNEVIVEVIEKLFPFLKPIFHAIVNASEPIGQAMRTFVLSPLAGFVDGFKFALINMKTFNLTLFVAIWFMIFSLVHIIFSGELSNWVLDAVISLVFACILMCYTRIFFN